MVPQLFLIAPADAGAGFAATLARVLAQSPVSALLLPRGGRSENAYKDFVKVVAPVAQAAGTAVLIEGEPGLVRTLGADGLHVGGSVGELRAALAQLKPDFIVGAGNIGSRHDAMSKGELEVDYILFGPLSGTISPGEREMARWWAQTMEIPGVLSDPQARADAYDAEGCEFIGLGAQQVEATN